MATGKIPNITQLTDSTTGTASDTLDYTTADAKDDLASLAAKVNAIIQALIDRDLMDPN
jgi:hypothetical protein